MPHRNACTARLRRTHLNTFGLFGLVLQGILLVSRTLLTDWISRVEGWSGSTLVSLVRRRV